jgi:lipid-binding SYLF domain-containing protein
MKPGVVISLLVCLAGIFGLAGCGSSSTSATDQRHEINTAANQALSQFDRDIKGGRELAAKAQGILVFPNVYAAGIGIGGQYGKGELRVAGQPVAYYSIASGTLGLTLGAQARNIVFLFMTQQALNDFRNSSGWQAGASAGVALVKTGSEGTIDTSQLSSPILAFVYGNTGLMVDVSVDGTKISRLDI